jgi:hypothetical protein
MGTMEAIIPISINICMFIQALNLDMMRLKYIWEKVYVHKISCYIRTRLILFSVIIVYLLGLVLLRVSGKYSLFNPNPENISHSMEELSHVFTGCNGVFAACYLYYCMLSFTVRFFGSWGI